MMKKTKKAATPAQIAALAKARAARTGKVDVTPQFVATVETVEQIEQKLADRFEALEIMTDATGRGINRSLIVSGPAGLGKSFTVEAKMAELEAKGHGVTYISGYIRPLALYRLLYNARHDNSVIVFDDADSIFSDDVSMNLLKKACDSTERRVIHWMSESVQRLEDEDGDSIPEKFAFEGSVIFITNYDFDAIINKGAKLAPHFQALVSRSHYLDLEMKSKMDYIVRIKQVVRGGMLREKGFSATQETMIVSFIEENMERLRELSLRMVVKLATLYKMNENNWQKLAKQTCFRAA
jgi:hypothetical protein